MQTLEFSMLQSLG